MCSDVDLVADVGIIVAVMTVGGPIVDIIDGRRKNSEVGCPLVYVASNE